jgi:hypothetical protein
VLELLKPIVVVHLIQAAAGLAGPDGTGPAEVGAVGAVLAEHDVEVELRGSPESMARQHAIAVASELTFVGTLEEMQLLAEEGGLVPIAGGRHYEVMDWVFPYGIPQTRTFVERLAAEYRAACGEALVVTSLTRPFSEQLPNSHQLSVHPAGMAVDLRIPQNPECREFLETRLLAKEAAGLLDITQERAPPHYHVAVFPEPYARWAASQPPIAGAEPAPAPTLAPLQDDPSGVVLPVALALLVLAAAGMAAAWFGRRSRGRGA